MQVICGALNHGECTSTLWGAGNQFARIVYGDLHDRSRPAAGISMQFYYGAHALRLISRLKRWP